MINIQLKKKKIQREVLINKKKKNIETDRNECLTDIQSTVASRERIKQRSKV